MDLKVLFMSSSVQKNSLANKMRKPPYVSHGVSLSHFNWTLVEKQRGSRDNCLYRTNDRAAGLKTETENYYLY